MKWYLHTEHQLTPNSLCCIVTFGSRSGRRFCAHLLLFRDMELQAINIPINIWENIPWCKPIFPLNLLTTSCWEPESYGTSSFLAVPSRVKIWKIIRISLPPVLKVQLRYGSTWSNRYVKKQTKSRMPSLMRTRQLPKPSLTMSRNLLLVYLNRNCWNEVSVDYAKPTLQPLYFLPRSVC